MSDNVSLKVLVITVLIAFIAGASVGIVAGSITGIAYQKAQPVNISFQSITDGKVVTTNYDLMTPKNTLGLPASGLFIEKNKIDSWYIRVVP